MMFLGSLATGHWKMNSVILLAIPLFIMAGDIMQRGKIANPIVEIAELMFGHLRGGLSAAAVVASAMFGAISGSGAATLTCIGGIIMPHLRKAKYPDGFSAALVISASPLGLLIPAQRRAVALCVGGPVVSAQVFPGNGRSRPDPDRDADHRKFRGPAEEHQHSDQRVPTAVLSFSLARRQPGRHCLRYSCHCIILGGIYGGIMTPTEAAGVAVIYAIPVGFFVYRGLTLHTFYESLKDSATTIGVVMVMIFMVLITSRFLIFEDIPSLAEDLIYSISDNPIVVILMINLVMLLIGMLMDDISGIILSASLLLPIAENAGMDPIHFAAVLGVNLGMGNITPPTAPLLYLGAQVTNVPVRDLIGPTMIFIIFAWLPTLLLTTFIPEIALFLPDLLLGN